MQRACGAPTASRSSKAANRYVYSISARGKRSLRAVLAKLKSCRQNAVIPKARVFTGGPSDLLTRRIQGDSSLRLKNGYVRDDAPIIAGKSKLSRSTFDGL